MGFLRIAFVTSLIVLHVIHAIPARHKATQRDKERELLIELKGEALLFSACFYFTIYRHVALQKVLNLWLFFFDQTIIWNIFERCILNHGAILNPQILSSLLLYLKYTFQSIIDPAKQIYFKTGKKAIARYEIHIHNLEAFIRNYFKYSEYDIKENNNKAKQIRKQYWQCQCGEYKMNLFVPYNVLHY